MFPALLAIPLVIEFSWRLVGILISAYFSGVVIEDFVWYLSHPIYNIKRFNKREGKWYPWIFGLPLYYWLAFFITIISWFFLWR